MAPAPAVPAPVPGGDTRTAPAPREEALNALLRRGDLLGAYTTFYADIARPWSASGPDAREQQVERVLQFLAWSERFHRATLIRSLTVGNVSRSAWAVHPDPRSAAAVMRMVTRRWSGGRVEREEHTDRATTPSHQQRREARQHHG